MMRIRISRRMKNQYFKLTKNYEYQGHNLIRNIVVGIDL